MPPNGELNNQSQPVPFNQNSQVPSAQVQSPAPMPTQSLTPESQPNTVQPQQTQFNSNEPSPQQRSKQNSTQNSLLISELRDGIVVLGDGSFRAVIACKSINFDLMSSRERESIEYSYQSFLNSLYFPIQIYIRSQRVDIGPYLDRLGTIRQNQDNMLLNVLMDNYMDFIDILSQEANIMDKSFFVIVPYYPTGDLSDTVEKSKGLFTKLFKQSKSSQVVKIDKATYEKAKEELTSRVNVITSGLMQVGVQSTQLNTKQLGELYYNIYNPDTAVREPLWDFNSVATTFVRKGVGESPRANQDGGIK